jgi:thiol:disulfide interchange protein DsbD
MKIAAAAALIAMIAGAACAQAVKTPHVESRLVAQTTGAAPGSTLYVAVDQTLDPGWHTYWRNPGDAGEPASIRWTLPKGWRAGEIVWPAPERFPLGPIMSYGFENRLLLPVPIEVPAGAKPGTTATLQAHVDYLVCAQVCIPGGADLSLNVPVVAGAPPMSPQWGATIAAGLAAAPKPAALDATFDIAGGKLRLSVAGAALAGNSAADAYFYPYDDKLIDHGRPETIDRGARGLTLAMTPGAAFTEGSAPTHTSGVLAVDGKVYEITARRGAAPAGSGGLGPPAATTQGGKAAGAGAAGILLAAGSAFLGGLILNLMPCVFPILSMKAAALAGHGNEPSRARGHGLAFLAGVMATFLTLAGVLIAARAAGAAVGWGFQLQSPLIVAGLSLLMLAAGLNLSGLFEVGASLQSVGSTFASARGLLGSVLTGVLAVIVAAPCTAPFMGPALGFALTEPPALALAVFAALGLGFAAPFTLLAFSPALMRRLPRPGSWMDVFRKALAFPMYAAAAWLAWVLAQQSGPEGLARLFAGAVALALAAWLYGLSQHGRAVGAGGRLALILSLASAAACVAVVAAGPQAVANTKSAAPTSAGPLAAEPFSPDRLAALRAEGRPVLVNFTAAWCVTCQVNERIAFSSASVADAFKHTGAAYLVADWTNRDPVIAKALSDQGRIGVPLYLVYKGQGAPRVLPQLLTPDIVATAIRTNG